MTYRCILLDFDGTFTDVEREAQPFVDHYRRGLTEALARNIDDEWDAAASRIDAQPEGFGWQYDGKVVAPAHADPYIRSTSIAQEIIDTQGDFSSADRADLLQRLYKENYEKSATVFRPEAREIVEALLLSDVHVFVVTNSYTESVEKKLARLAPRGLERLRVFGDAKKYVIAEPETQDERFEALPESLCIDALDRPVLLQRGKYFDVLASIWKNTKTTPEETIICGDIYELDLAMPSQLGVASHLVTRGKTPEYEKRAVDDLPAGAYSNDLGTFLARVLG